MFQATLNFADLRGARLDDAQLARAHLRATRLQGASLRAAELQGADLWTSELQDADLEGAGLQGAQLAFTQLQRASLKVAQLQGADLNNANLAGAVLDNAEVEAADLAFADLRGASLNLVHLQAASLVGAELRGAALVGSEVQGTSLNGAVLDGAWLDKVFVWRADARGADIARAMIHEPVTGPSHACMEDSTICKWDSAAFAKFKQEMEAEIPDGSQKDRAIALIERQLDPAKTLDGEADMAQTWSSQSFAPPDDEVWRAIGCAGKDAPYVIQGLLHNFGHNRTGAAPSPTLGQALAVAFLDEAHCPGARGLSELDKKRLQEIRDRPVPTKPPERASANQRKRSIRSTIGVRISAPSRAAPRPFGNSWRWR
jgi:uncharacterized protein YjbI with pentapeptide repeats